jgi:hypothetical protein
MIQRRDFINAGVESAKIMETELPNFIYDITFKKIHRGNLRLHVLGDDIVRRCVSRRSITGEMIDKINRSTHGIAVKEHPDYYCFCFLYN